ncbi:MAG TPA: phage holin family protein [Gemmatimonadales bacterium]|jgi:putative membrane protein|nr:phage holin family protein [Gemmatimonadales bacterium]
MRHLLIRLLINAVALFAAVKLIPGMHFSGGLTNLLLVALVFGLVNAVVRPILTLLSCPLIVVTLGLFLLVINAGMLWLTSWLSDKFALGFQVDGFLPALLGGLVIGIVSTALTLFVGRAADA